MLNAIQSNIWEQKQESKKKDEFILLAREYLTDQIQNKTVDIIDDNSIFQRMVNYLVNKADINTQQANEIADEVLIDIRGYGIIAPLINDPYVSDIIVHKEDDITYERLGEKHTYHNKFRDRQHLMMFIEKLAFLSKARIDISNPLATFTLPEGYRTAVAIPPVAVTPTIAIRKFVDMPTVDDLIENGYFSEEAGAFFKAAIKSKRNILITGGMGSGKTSLISIASNLFDEEDQPLLIEEVMEVPMNIPHLRRLVARPPSVEGTGEVTLANLLKQGLMMKPTRLIVSEVRDGAIFHMLQAMQVGHEGSMSTVHANNPKEALFKRIPMMLSMSKEAVDLSYEEKLSFAASGIHLIVHLKQDPFTGKRYCEKISEVIEEPKIDVKDIFIRKGETMEATGHIPKRTIDGAMTYGVKYNTSWFEKEDSNV